MREAVRTRIFTKIIPSALCFSAICMLDTLLIVNRHVLSRASGAECL